MHTICNIWRLIRVFAKFFNMRSVKHMCSLVWNLIAITDVLLFSIIYDKYIIKFAQHFRIAHQSINRKFHVKIPVEYSCRLSCGMRLTAEPIARHRLCGLQSFNGDGLRLQCIACMPLKTPWSESASELYRPSDRRFSAKCCQLVPLTVETTACLKIIWHTYSCVQESRITSMMFRIRDSSLLHEHFASESSCLFLLQIVVTSGMKPRDGSDSRHFQTSWFHEPKVRNLNIYCRKDYRS
jgi:hypothetical protein